MLTADGKIQCPEGQLECGIKEVNPEDLPKRPKDNKKMLLIIGAAAFVIILLSGIVFVTTGKKGKKTDEVTTKTELAKTPLGKDTTVASTQSSASSDASPASTDNSANLPGGIPISGIQSAVFGLASDTQSDAQKLDIVNNIVKDFVSDDAEVTVTINGQNSGVYSKIRSYLTNIIVTKHKVTIVHKEMAGNKISKITVTEN